MDLEFAKELYTAEIQRQNSLRSALTLPVGTLALLGGATGSMTMGFSYHSKPLTVSFLLLSILSFLILVAVAFCLVRPGIEHREEQGGSHGTETGPGSAGPEADPASTAGRKGSTVAQEATEPLGVSEDQEVNDDPTGGTDR